MIQYLVRKYLDFINKVAYFSASSMSASSYYEEKRLKQLEYLKK